MAETSASYGDDASKTGFAGSVAPGPAMAARVIERAGLLLVLAGIITTAIAPFIRWESDFALWASAPDVTSSLGNQQAAVLVVLLLGPVVSGSLFLARFPGRFFAADRGYRRFRRSVWVIVAAVVLCSLSIRMSAVIPARDRGPGGPLLAAGAAVLLAGWLALAAGQRPRRSAQGARRHGDMSELAGASSSPRRGARWVWTWAAALAGTAAGVAAVVISQFSVWTPVDHTTTSAPLFLSRQPAGQAAGVGAGHVRWRLTTTAARALNVLVAGGSVVLVGTNGVTVLSDQTGRERWHYRRSDAVVIAAAVTTDGRFLVVRMRRLDDFTQQSQISLTVGFSLATGQLLWQRPMVVADMPGTEVLGGYRSERLVAFGDYVLMTCNVPVIEFGGPPCGSSAFVFSAASGVPGWETQSCGPLGPVGGATALAGAVSPGPGCQADTIEILTTSGARHLWRPPDGGRLADFTLFPPPPIATLPDGFLVPFQAGPAAVHPGTWAVAPLTAAGAEGTPVPIPCHDPRIVERAAQVVACASLAEAGSGWTVKAGAVSDAGRVAWRRELSFPSAPYISASEGILYFTTGQPSGPYSTLALGLGDGVTAGHFPGFPAGTGDGLAIIADSHGQRVTVTAFS